MSPRTVPCQLLLAASSYRLCQVLFSGGLQVELTLRLPPASSHMHQLGILCTWGCSGDVIFVFLCQTAHHPFFGDEVL